MDQPTMLTEIDMEKVMSFHHEETVQRFISNYDVTYEESYEIFQETKKFLALMARYPKEHVFAVESIYVLDEMWHTFLMFTKDYHNFCVEHFGFMIHHEPMKKAEKEQTRAMLADNKEEAEKILRPNIEKLYSLIYDFHGNETLIKWIRELGEKYTIAHINKIRKPIVI